MAGDPGRDNRNLDAPVFSHNLRAFKFRRRTNCSDNRCVVKTLYGTQLCHIVRGKKDQDVEKI